MRLKVAILLGPALLFLLLSCGEEKGTGGSSADTWTVTLNRGESVNIQSMLAVNDGYIGAGIIGDGDSDFYFLKIDLKGHIVWEQTHDVGSWDTDWQIVPCDGGNYLVAGHGWRDGTTIDDPYLLKLDGTGHVIWERRYGGDAYDIASGVAVAADGSYVLAGSTESFEGEDEDIYLVRTDTSGDLLWETTFGGAGRDVAAAVIATPDNGCLIAAQTQGNPEGMIGLFKADAEGNLEWERHYGADTVVRIFTMIRGSDDGFVLAGYRHEFDEMHGSSNPAYLLKVNDAGDVEWETFVGDRELHLRDRVWSIVAAHDGGYVFTADIEYQYTYGGHQEPNDILLAKIGRDGELTWQRVLDTGTSEHPHCVVAAPDGGFLVSAAVFDGVTNILLLKTDESGDL